MAWFRRKLKGIRTETKEKKDTLKKLVVYVPKNKAETLLSLVV